MSGVVFDLDGTLIESAPAIRDIANRCMAKWGLPALDLDETRSYVGNGAARFLERALIACSTFDRETFPAHYEAFHALYATAPPEDNVAMPRSVTAMREIVAAGHRLALCTNKPMAPTQQMTLPL